jgi:hypothetical protein
MPDGTPILLVANIHLSLSDPDSDVAFVTRQSRHHNPNSTLPVHPTLHDRTEDLGVCCLY